MVILARIKKRDLILLGIVFLIGCGIGAYLCNLSRKKTAAVVKEEIPNILREKIKQIFDRRNQALLEEDKEDLKRLYDLDITKGIWAYEHALKKMKYLHNWSAKQGVKFKEIDSKIIVRKAEPKGDRISVTLMVSTEYQYIYQGAKPVNSFRIGTYHVLDLTPRQGRLIIVKEWYTDPFADSLHLDNIKNQEIKQYILSKNSRDLSNLKKRRKEAVEYVDKYCGAASLPKYGFRYNPEYKNYNYLGGDCANFASQMLYEGAGFTKSSIWSYKHGKGSKAWVNAHSFNNYMINSGRASVIARGTYKEVLKPSYKLLPGDYIAYEKKGKVAHISVVSGADSKGYVLVNSHNTDRYRVPWDLGWSNKGIKFWLVRVHY